MLPSARLALRGPENGKQIINIPTIRRFYWLTQLARGGCRLRLSAIFFAMRSRGPWNSQSAGGMFPARLFFSSRD